MEKDNKKANNHAKNLSALPNTRCRGGLKRRLLTWFLLLSLAPLIIVSAISYYSAKNRLREAAMDSLYTNVNSKAAFISNWFNYRFIDLQSQAAKSENARFIEALEGALQRSGKKSREFVRSKEWQAIVDRWGGDLKTFRRLYGYGDVFLIDTEGNILFTLNAKDDLGANLFQEPLADTKFSAAARQSLDTGDKAFSDLEYYSPARNAIAGFFTAAITNKAGKKAGLFAFRITSSQVEKAMRSKAGEEPHTHTYVIGYSSKNNGVTFRSQAAAISPYEGNNYSPGKTRIASTGMEAYLETPINTKQTRLWMAEHSREGAHMRDHSEEGFIYDDPNGTLVLGIHQTISIGGIEWGIISEIPTYVAFAPARKLLHMVIGFLLLTALLVTIIVTITTRRIIRPILRLSGAAALVAGGNLGEKIEVKSQDEIGDLGRSFNIMVEALKEHKNSEELKEWFQAGRVELSFVLSGNKDLVEHSRRIVTFLASYLGAEVGALYIIDNDNSLRLRGSYAYPHEEGQTKTFKPGEGLVGQAALGKERILLTDVPHDYIAIRSALGEASPGAIVVQPFTHENKVVGVIELAAFGTFSEKALDFLNLVSGHIAVSVTTFLEHIKVQKLLERSQGQTEELQAQQQELRVTNEELILQKFKLEDRNSEIEKAKLELEKKSAALEQAGKYKSEFLANVSHELRTPLTAILQFVSIIQDGLAGEINKEQHKYLEITLKNARQLKHMIGDLLDITRAASGKLTVNLNRFLIEGVITETLQIFEKTASEKGIALTTKIFPQLPGIYADPSRVHQILANLIENALKFTPENGEITVHADIFDEDPAFFFLEVRDTGSGIAPEDTKAIFERLYQSESTIEDSRKGLGLGLHICKTLVERQGGHIWLTSRVGEGSSFFFTLPLYSLERLLEPILKKSSGKRGNLSLIAVNIMLAEDYDEERDADNILDRALLVINQSIHPYQDQDVILPRMGHKKDGEVFFIVANTDTNGAEAIKKRIADRLTESDVLEGVELKLSISHRMLDDETPGEDKSTEEYAKYIAMRIEQLADNELEKRRASL